MKPIRHDLAPCPRRRASRAGLLMRLAGGAAALGALAAVLLGWQPAALADAARPLPAPVLDETPGATRTETAVFSGGCFWGVQGVFEHVAGVEQVAAGYAGGAASTAQYEAVSEGDTGHAESVRVVYDPSRITYGRLLQIFFSVAHDPTELNRQGPDTGTQYRSAIFPVDAQQKAIALAYIRQLTDAHAFPAPIVTSIEAGQRFYPAEAYHQDFLVRHPAYPYIVINDLPKVAALKAGYPKLYVDTPVRYAPDGN
ncbi:peptide-methionine (S)-S-oxide reductase MsrA [Burkholderia glumae]|uniref:Peptide methionine sulfoxide reductase MsrA n=2 Tax=Burkholderia glumae TaxID=337 RepID=A0AAP9XW03_BURGL|nr:peptide-methionine (S)-S-oxide reductase MsrA [Burkholderia glumae]ACR31893.1 Peptide methionine sulfoxide reductase [Burkholderia glumae BGR1]AJY62748.1 peptide-methionine (S)-S-oxide reductase [Burkholderia glumae LMG 2196 = ATCC 33617]KHJ59902.1 methionine sulfoxide reductase A [Burkholderia glumae]MCM2484928.1 peptide-methionine (S)-S-oxide reductase MsrA [Burkholderia glumae]MCM2495282.1 peptide-methionine (S)-S-oxide reductase MsrA [Burkholderia glumae]